MVLKRLLGKLIAKFCAEIEAVKVELFEVVETPCTTFELRRPAASVPVQAGLKVQVEEAQTILSKRLVSVVVEKVMLGEKVTTPPAVSVEEAIVPFNVLPDHDK